jgi:hypothetical protein
VHMSIRESFSIRCYMGTLLYYLDRLLKVMVKQELADSTITITCDLSPSRILYSLKWVAELAAHSFKN